jgi:hypothetical protein
MPWICDKCGEVADGAMCIKCGKAKMYTPAPRDHNIAAYTGGSAPVIPGGSDNKLMKWGPMSWIALALGILFMAAMYMSNVR